MSSLRTLSLFSRSYVTMSDDGVEAQVSSESGLVLSTTTIIGMTLGAVFGLVLGVAVLAAVYYCHRKKKRIDKEKRELETVLTSRCQHNNQDCESPVFSESHYRSVENDMRELKLNLSHMLNEGHGDEESFRDRDQDVVVSCPEHYALEWTYSLLNRDSPPNNHKDFSTISLSDSPPNRLVNSPQSNSIDFAPNDPAESPTNSLANSYPADTPSNKSLTSPLSIDYTSITPDGCQTNNFLGSPTTTPVDSPPTTLEDSPRNNSVNSSPTIPVHSPPTTPKDSPPNNSVDSSPTTQVHSPPNDSVDSLPTTPEDSPPNNSVDSAPTTPEDSPPNDSVDSPPTTPVLSPPNDSVDSAPTTPEDSPLNNSVNASPTTPEDSPPNNSVDSAPTTPEDSPPNNSVDSPPTTLVHSPPNDSVDSLPTTPEDSPPNNSVDSAPTTPEDSPPNYLVESSPATQVDSRPNQSVDSHPASMVNSHPTVDFPLNRSVVSSPTTPVDSTPKNLVDSPPTTLVDSALNNSVDSIPTSLEDSLPNNSADSTHTASPSNNSVDSTPTTAIDSPPNNSVEPPPIPSFDSSTNSSIDSFLKTPVYSPPNTSISGTSSPIRVNSERSRISSLKADTQDCHTVNIEEVEERKIEEAAGVLPNREPCQEENVSMEKDEATRSEEVGYMIKLTGDGDLNYQNIITEKNICVKATENGINILSELHILQEKVKALEQQNEVLSKAHSPKEISCDGKEKIGKDNDTSNKHLKERLDTSVDSLKIDDLKLIDLDSLAKGRGSWLVTVNSEVKESLNTPKSELGKYKSVQGTPMTPMEELQWLRSEALVSEDLATRNTLVNKLNGLAKSQPDSSEKSRNSQNNVDVDRTRSPLWDLTNSSSLNSHPGKASEVQRSVPNLNKGKSRGAARPQYSLSQNHISENETQGPSSVQVPASRQLHRGTSRTSSNSRGRPATGRGKVQSGLRPSSEKLAKKSCLPSWPSGSSTGTKGISRSTSTKLPTGTGPSPTGPSGVCRSASTKLPTGYRSSTADPSGVYRSSSTKLPTSTRPSPTGPSGVCRSSSTKLPTSKRPSPTGPSGVCRSSSTKLPTGTRPSATGPSGVCRSSSTKLPTGTGPPSTGVPKPSARRGMARENVGGTRSGCSVI